MRTKHPAYTGAEVLDRPSRKIVQSLSIIVPGTAAATTPPNAASTDCWQPRANRSPPREAPVPQGRPNAQPSSL